MWPLRESYWQFIVSSHQDQTASCWVHDLGGRAATPRSLQINPRNIGTRCPSLPEVMRLAATDFGCDGRHNRRFSGAGASPLRSSAFREVLVQSVLRSRDRCAAARRTCHQPNEQNRGHYWRYRIQERLKLSHTADGLSMDGVGWPSKRRALMVCGAGRFQSQVAPRRPINALERSHRRSAVFYCAK